MKKVVRLTESQLIKVIKNVIKEQKEVPVVPSDTIVKKVGTGIKIGVEGKSANVYTLYLGTLGKTDVTEASLSGDYLKIEVSVTYGTGGIVEKKLEANKEKLKSTGIVVNKKEGGAFEKDRFLFTINIKKNKKVAQGLIDARKGTQYIELTDDVALKIA